MYSCRTESIMNNCLLAVVIVALVATAVVGAGHPKQ